MAEEAGPEQKAGSGQRRGLDEEAGVWIRRRGLDRGGGARERKVVWHQTLCVDFLSLLITHSWTRWGRSTST